MKGLHGSTYFTLSLPVSRARLFLVRTALGVTEAAVVILVLCAVAWLAFPALSANATEIDALRHAFTVFVWGFGFYGLAVLVSTVLDDVQQVWVTTTAVIVLWLPPVRQVLNVFAPVTEASPFITHAVPWTPLAVALAVGTSLLLASLKRVETQDH
jgi:hypothetical protein